MYRVNRYESCVAHVFAIGIVANDISTIRVCRASLVASFMSIVFIGLDLFGVVLSAVL